MISFSHFIIDLIFPSYLFKSKNLIPHWFWMFQFTFYLPTRFSWFLFTVDFKLGFPWFRYLKKYPNWVPFFFYLTVSCLFRFCLESIFKINFIVIQWIKLFVWKVWNTVKKNTEMLWRMREFKLSNFLHVLA